MSSGRTSTLDTNAPQRLLIRTTCMMQIFLLLELAQFMVVAKRAQFQYERKQKTRQQHGSNKKNA
jgi:hypothetical protein